MDETCEFCALPAQWRYFMPDYERFSCGNHIKSVRRLIALDRPFPQTYQFEAVGEYAKDKR